MRIVLAQINPTIGDLQGNVDRCLKAIEHARRQGAALVVLPEMAVPGYPPRDILYDASFTTAVAEANRDLADRARRGPPVLVGTIAPSGRHLPHHPGLYNAALLLVDGETHLAAAKRLLRPDDVYHEPRWFIGGPKLPPVSIAGKQVGVLLGEDLFDAGHQIHPARELTDAGAELFVCLCASPYHRAVMDERLCSAKRLGRPLIYNNLVGGNDELIFDGRSFALDKTGKLTARLNGFEEETRLIDIGNDPLVETAAPHPENKLFKALVLGVRDFAHKNNITQAFLGLSGGIDSAVVAVIAAHALGPDNVTAVAIPSRYTDPRSTECARELAARLNIHFQVVDMEPLHRAAEETLGSLLDAGTAAENIQARIRAIILMGYVNRRGGILLNTSNKTELTVGYGTLYGDTTGTLCPIADLTKPQVIRLAHWLNEKDQVIPEFTLSRPPSAELKPNQVDPFDYAVISPELEKLVQSNQSNEAMRRGENKRWGMGVILRVSKKSFGSGRMIPITRM